jgi:flagellar biosynthetic protein FliR
VADGGLIGWLAACLLLGLRVAPVFALAPPFTLTRVPMLFRVLFALGLAGWLVTTHPAAAQPADLSAGGLTVAALRELLVGIVFVLAFQLTFAALQFAGRTVDVQAGFGLAGLIDPTTQHQSPLTGTLLALAAAAVFFAMNGHHDLLRLFAASLETVPLGTAEAPVSIARLTGFVSVVFLMAIGVAGAAILTLFLADLTVALMSRTLPQMNVLVIGFQVKTLLLLFVLPTMFGFAGALLARMIAITFEAIPGLL